MKKIKKNIFIITGSRAEYDLLKNLIFCIKDSKKMSPTIIVTGQHISKKYGNTFKDANKDFKGICKFIDVNVGSTNSKSILNTIGIGVKKIGKFLENKKPDMIILLGDRYEIFSAAIASLYNKSIIIHIQGGEITAGSFDDVIRHSITKLSDYHFVSTEIYKKRVIQLGENPKRVFNVGSLGAENVKKIKLINKSDLANKLKIKFNKYNFLITVNSFIDDDLNIKNYMSNIFSALKKFKNTNFIFTMPNSDLKSDIINKEILKFSKKNKNSYCFKSLGSQNYLSIMKISDVVIGNSSSGILEAPSMKIPTVNIGNRQKGRVQSKTTINCNPLADAIYKSINKCLTKKFIKKVQLSSNPYYKKNTAINIKKIIENKIINQKKEFKIFYDIE